MILDIPLKISSPRSNQHDRCFMIKNDAITMIMQVYKVHMMYVDMNFSINPISFQNESDLYLAEKNS